MTSPRIIKKYPNRRLYDTEESRYITLHDIRQLVMDKVEFQVIDKQSGEDITRGILLQVITEQEQTGDPLLSLDVLTGIIRSYGGAMQSVARAYLDQSMKFFTDQQTQLRERIRASVGVDPVNTVTGMAQRNLERFKNLQEELLRTFRRDRPDDDN